MGRDPDFTVRIVDANGDPDSTVAVIDGIDDLSPSVGDSLVWDGSAWRAQPSGAETVVAHGNTGATETVDVNAGTFHTAALDASCTFTFTNPADATHAWSFTLELTQGSGGSKLAIWPASVDWPGGTAPTLSTAAGAVDVLAFFTHDGGTTWRGVLAMADSK